ncbi:acetylgalactosaminyl-O-glycosyl-glycoprotein beta-1,3-N-acetylglucosaminyltransferase-like isoform X2 [Hyla sarda]|uniref:acetylgalactosaminyl-O-glycosyl-glycoprotein beta-1,3-N-acetylglucosaminyltransferase-like isoform X2 n=1 Tax=Hyla sarda TaxID=327740 RepID=UPI0024C4539C|nr:acetylgalactosaminyl-O-glycosyl-glycoprotein beta-1,3-N-acetylglucosaminyltransferase-like isoform X2 [Hyla sarda]
MAVSITVSRETAVSLTVSHLLPLCGLSAAYQANILEASPFISPVLILGGEDILGPSQVTMKLLVRSFGLTILLVFLLGILFMDGKRSFNFFFRWSSRCAPPDPKSPSYSFQRESVSLDDGVHVYHLNFCPLQEEFPHLQNYLCSVTLTPKMQLEAFKPLIVLAIKSHPESGSRRAALRRTWAQKWQLDSYELRPIFLMGHTNVSGHMESVRTESQKYGDVLQWDFTEGHHNLSLKERCFLKWVVQRIPHVAFIFKGDDDEYVSPPALVQYIKTFATDPRVLHGYLRPHSEVMRHTKYAVSEYIFPGNIYPTFLSGGGFLYSGPAAELLYTVSQKMPVFPLDDVYFGFLVLAADLSFRHDKRFYVYGLKFEPCQYQKALVVHGVSPEELVERWSKAQNAKCQKMETDPPEKEDSAH